MDRTIEFIDRIQLYVGQKFFHITEGYITFDGMDTDGYGYTLSFNNGRILIDPISIVNPAKSKLIMLYPSEELFKEFMFKGEEAWVQFFNRNRTWEQLCTTDKVKKYNIFYYPDDVCDTVSRKRESMSKEELSVDALMKIIQVINAGYCGLPSMNDWTNAVLAKYVIIYKPSGFDVKQYYTTDGYSPISFYSKEQADIFLSYQSNVQLLKDYYMI